MLDVGKYTQDWRMNIYIYIKQVLSYHLGARLWFHLYARQAALSRKINFMINREGVSIDYRAEYLQLRRGLCLDTAMLPN